MRDPSKARQAQMRELASLRKRIAELEQAQLQDRQMEERLRGSEQRLRGIILNAQSGYFFIDRDGIYRQVNDAWLRMHKYDSPDEIIGRHYSVTQVGRDLDKAQQNVERLLAGEPFPTGEFSRLCKDGSIGYHTFSASPVLSDHEVIGLEGFLIDTTEHKKNLDALRAGEGRFRSIFDNSLDAILLTMPGGEIVSANRATQSLLGMTEEEICRAGRAGIVVQDEALARAIEEREKKGKWRGILTYRRKDGSTFAAEVSSNVFRAPDSGDRTITIFRDVSERKQMQEALRKSEIFLKETQLIARLGGWKANPHTDYLEWSDGVYSIIEAPRDYSPGYAEGRKYFPPEYGPVLQDKISDCLETGVPFRVELQLITDTGKRRWAEVRGLAPVIEGERSFVVGTLQDITERKEAELALRESEERFRLFMDNSPTIAWIKDEQGRYVYLSGTYEARFGVQLKDWIGKTDAELWPPEIAENFRKNDLAVLAAGRPIEVTEETVSPDGSRCHWLNSKFPFRAADGERYIAGIGLDITEQKKAEDELTIYREHLEALVKERTGELENKTQILEELNAATRALLRQREEDRKELEERFVANMKNLILPYAEKMKKTHLDERQLSYLGIMEAHFNEIMSPLMKTMQQRNFTPTESQVASLIKDGKTTKEIAAIMGVAPSSIDTHRKSIRRKLGLNNVKANLQSHLQSIGI